VAIKQPAERSGRHTPTALRRAGDRVARWTTAIGLERSARLGSVAIIPLLLTRTGFHATELAFAGLAMYVLVTALAPRDRLLRRLDLVVAAIVIIATGSYVTAYVPFVLVAIAGPAARGGPRAATAAGLTLSTVLIVRLAFEAAPIDTSTTVLLAVLLPLTGLATAAGMDVLDQRAIRDRIVLEEANRLLSSLRTLADDLPGGLDATTISAALLAELTQVEGATQAVVYVDDHGMQRPAAASAVPSDALTSLRVDVVRQLLVNGANHLRPRHELPAAVRRACERSLVWLAQPVGDLDQLLGLVLVGFDDHEAARRACPLVAEIASDGLVALDNARLFEGTRSRAADAARRQVAADLHDGVAQSLTHLRMELELLARCPELGAHDEAARLARVATSALDQLRRTIRHLDTPMTGNLAAVIVRHLEDLRAPHGPDLVFDANGAVELAPEQVEDALRIAQEAISNALRHAEAGTITVDLEQDQHTTALVVEDDGVGLGATSHASADPRLAVAAPRAVASQHGGAPSTPARHDVANNGRRGGQGRDRGIGLRSMHERADRLGGSLTIRDRAGGGTVVTLRFPTRPAAAPTPR
jgi:signal transduction histidine kinase